MTVIIITVPITPRLLADHNIHSRRGSGEKEGKTKGIFRDHNDDLACIHASMYNTFLVSAVGFAIRGATRG
jgi:hypothetical protein